MQARFRNLAVAGAAVPLLSALVLAGTSMAASDPSVALTDNVNPATAHSHRLGDVAPNQQFPITVALKPHDAAGLDRFLAAVNDPKSPEYHHYLSPQQYVDRFAPTQADVDAVTAYLKRQGITVTGVSANRQSVNATGNAAQLKGAFATGMGNYSDADHRGFFANDAAPSLPATVASKVRGILGLNNHTVRKARNTGAHPKKPADGGYGPKELKSNYDVDAMQADGSGQTVGFWEFDGYNKDNLKQYSDKYQLGAAAPTTVSVDGANYDNQPGQGQVEVELDVEVVNGIAPKAAALVYEAPNSDQGELHMAQQIGQEKKISVLSISWGGCEAARDKNGMKSVDDAFKQIASEGIAVFSASGDDGSADCKRQNGSTDNAVDFPASDPFVTGVGGTSLTDGGGKYGSEKAWNGSGGGTSTVFDAPKFQKGDNGKRTVPDVSADADPATGYAIYSNTGSGNGWGTVGGTSAAAPLWAGWALDYGQKAGKPLGSANDALYQAAGAQGGKAFHDVTDGSNGGFKAGPGYDQVTGNGTPDGNELLKALHTK